MSEPEVSEEIKALMPVAVVAPAEEPEPKPQGPALPSVWDQCCIFADSQRFNATPQQIFVQVMAGKELGLGPFASMSGINVIKGKPTMGAHMHASFIKSSPKYDYRVIPESEQQCSHAERCAIRFRERVDGKWEEIGVEVWTLADAERAQISGGQNWKKYPKAMLFARAISSGCRTYCPDVFHGLTVYGEGELDV